MLFVIFQVAKLEFVSNVLIRPNQTFHRIQLQPPFLSRFVDGPFQEVYGRMGEMDLHERFGFIVNDECKL